MQLKRLKDPFFADQVTYTVYTLCAEIVQMFCSYTPTTIIILLI